ncbi:hypothetical protein ACWGKS_26430 [Nocardiopsis sp. NPDC055879]
MNDIDDRGMPARHEPAEDGGYGSDDWRKGPALARHENILYADFPSPPADVSAARDAMDSAAALIGDLDRAARQTLAEYKGVGGRARVAARDAVARGESPPSTEEADAERDRLARRYKDAVAHRKAVEDHLAGLVARYHQVAEAALPAWRDLLAANLDDQADAARTALSKALVQAREAVALAVAVETMDRPMWNPQHDAPRKSALAGRELPANLEPDATRGTGGTNYAAGTTEIDADLDAVARLATRWLRVEGNHQLGQGPIPEALTMQTTDMPERTTPVERFDPDAASRRREWDMFLGQQAMAHGLPVEEQPPVEG